MYQAVRVNHFHPGNSEKPVQNHQNVRIGKGIFAIDIVGRYVIFNVSSMKYKCLKIW